MGQRRQVCVPTNDRGGIVGWVIVALVVIAFDGWALSSRRQTMSAAFVGAARRPGCRELLVVMWGALTWHLFGGHPDPLRKLVGA